VTVRFELDEALAFWFTVHFNENFIRKERKKKERNLKGEG